MKQTILISTVALFLNACGMYGTGYPKPEYNYAGISDDPELRFESDFGVNTQITARTRIKGEDDSCLKGQRVAYLQAMDSYHRDPDAKGPWSISAPADQPIVITAQWTRNESQYYDSLTHTTRIYPVSSCPLVAKEFSPARGNRYRIHLRNAGPSRCE